MAAEPINIFSRKVDPRGVVQILRRLAPTLHVIGPDDCWEKIVVAGPKRLFGRSWSLTFVHDPEYYDGPGWTRQVLGMQGYFMRFPGIDERPEILRLIGSLRFALATSFDPDRIMDADERLVYLFAVARFLDGVIFTPSSLRDANGKVLIAADGEYDPDAVLPHVPETTANAEAAEPSALEQDDDEPEPPTADRIACRVVALTAVAARALLEQENASDAMVEARRKQLLEWVEVLGIANELEPDEWKVLQRPVGSLDRQATVNATWRLEGLAVLAWALGRFEVPAYDQLVEPGALLSSVGFLDEDAARALLTEAKLRPTEELQRYGTEILALHWRLRNFTLRPDPMDFPEFGRNAWFGPFDLSSFRLIANDLAIGGYEISKAPSDVFQATISSAMERHLAINWLRGYSRIYSETDTST